MEKQRIQIDIKLLPTYQFEVEELAPGLWHAWHEDIPGMDVYTMFQDQLRSELEKKVREREGRL